MAFKVKWQEPDDTNITTIEVGKAATKHGSFSVASTFSATSDGGAKTSANTWITTYLDTAGVRTNWYRVRFYEGTNLIWSDYSSPISTMEEVRLCTVAEVQKNIKTVGRFTDDEIFNAIDEIEEEVYEEMGTPINNILTQTGNINSVLQNTYYVGEQNVYRIDRVFYGTTTKTELFLDDGYKINLPFGMIRTLPVASSGPTLNEQSDFEISYVPKLIHRYALYKTCEYLLEQIDYINRGTASKELLVIRKKLARVEQRLMYQNGLNVSSSFDNYSMVYPNQNRIIQNFDKNKYLASYGW